MGTKQPSFLPIFCDSIFIDKIFLPLLVSSGMAKQLTFILNYDFDLQFLKISKKNSSWVTFFYNFQNRSFSEFN